ncbi:permease [Halomicroarcula sp. GCM10025894]|uniref:permease n=1 Tax=Halomicroarcula sp. GCM10025894 TaxID=3252673 RepID=UPI00361495E9
MIPVVESLIGKGLPIGTGLAFMMSVAALSLPQFMILSKVMRKELIASFAVTLGSGILFIGLLFNAVI